MNIDAAISIERGHATILLESIFVGSNLYKADGCKTGGLTGLGLKSAIEVSGIFSHLG